MNNVIIVYFLLYWVVVVIVILTRLNRKDKIENRKRGKTSLVTSNISSLLKLNPVLKL
jgi:hypothetical protein